MGLPGPVRQIRTRSASAPQRSWRATPTVRCTGERGAIFVASRLEHDGGLSVIAACCGVAGDNVLATTVRRSGAQRQVSALDRVAVPLPRLTTPIRVSLRPV